MNKPLSLIVEDDIKLSEVFSKSLESAKFETQIVHDGQLAIERLKHRTPEVVILDLHLPHVSGEAVLKYLRSWRRFSKTMVIVVTADPGWSENLRLETDLVLIKPVSPLLLRELASRLHLSAMKNYATA